MTGIVSLFAWARVIVMDKEKKTVYSERVFTIYVVQAI